LRILDRYIAGSVIGGTLLALAVLLPLLGFFLLADEMDQIGERDYQFFDALVFVTLTMPRYGYELFPIATLIGAVVGLGSLASGSELVAMRAAGVSIGRLVLAALKGGVPLALAAILIGEGLAPYAQQEGQQRRSEALTGQVMQHTASGFWARDGNTFVNIREILSGSNLRDISIYEVGPGRTLTLASHAAEARYADGQWTLESIARSRLSLDGVQVEQIERARWDSLLSPRLLEVVVIEPQALPIWDLYHYVRFMANTDQDGRNYEIALWSKLVQPALILTMILVAIPILLGSARTTSMGTQIVFAIFAGIAFYLLSRTLVHFSLLFDLSPMIAATLPPTLFAAGALWLLRRVG
jgi:lipopolysaccharide export system permease protein